MAGGGGGDADDIIPVSPRARQPRGGRRRQKQAAAACLPLDVIVEEIAARSDAATLVRCAATCRDARRRIAEDPDLRARLRLRDTGRFLLPLLSGVLMGINANEGYGNRKTNVYLMGTATASLAETETLRDAVSMDSRGGLVLARCRATSQAHLWQPQHDLQLRVCNPATGRSQNLPPEPAFLQHGESTDVQYVLLVGDGEGGAIVGRPFQVLKAKLVLSKRSSLYHRLMVHTFSSEHGAWSPLTEIPTPDIHGSHGCWASRRKVLVVGDVLHWLCLTDSGSYIVMLHVRAARVDVMALPASFPRCDAPGYGRYSYLLATDSAGGSPVVLVADTEDKNIRTWEQCNRTRSKPWKARPQVVIEGEAIMGFHDDEVKEAILRIENKMVNVFGREEGTRRTRAMCGPELCWFGERSGLVLLRTHGCCLLWLDLHSKKIFRCFSSEWERRMSGARVYCPYEVDLSSWVPTFSSAVTTI